MQTSGRNMTIRQLIVALLSFFLLTGIGGGILAAAALPIAATTGTVANAGTRVFDDLPTDIDFTKPSEQSVILASDGSRLATFFAENRIVVASDQISPLIKQAAVAIEDERFYSHHGIDAQGLIGAALNNFTGGRLAGGSTITQQYVKNAIIEEGRVLGDTSVIASATKRSISRKLNEARYAIAVENKLSKDEILTGYLNLAQFGPSQWGVEAASRYFFGVPAKDVSLPQAAMIAGITQAPGKWNPVTAPEQAKKRRDTVLGQMYKLDMITREELEAAVAVPIADMLNVTNVPNGCAEAGISAYFCEWAVKDALNDPALGKTREERTQALYRGGIVIHTTIDPTEQKAAFDAVVNSIPVDDPSSINLALSSIEPGTGHIRAMVQNTAYGNPTAERPNDMTLNLNAGMNMGGGSGFQAGSTFKLFALMEWLNEGHSLMDRVNGAPMKFQPGSWKISCAPGARPGEAWGPGTLEGLSTGTMTVLEATKKSVNPAFAQMANKMDLCKIMDMASNLGVERGRIALDGDKEFEQVVNLGLPNEKGQPLPLVPNPAAIIGTNPVTPLSMASAMATIAADGNRCEPQSYTKIEDSKGNVLSERKPQCRQVIEADLARQTTTALQAVVSPGATGARAMLAGGRPAAGKTGTANSDTNAWFVGYTPQLATAIWQGHHEGYVSMFDSVIKGVYHKEVFGGLYPAMTFKAFMDAALADEPVIPFKKPTKSIRPASRTNLTGPDAAESPDANDAEAAAPALVGQSQQEAQDAALAAGFGYVTRAERSDQPAGTVLRQVPAPGEPATPGQRIEIWISAGN
ncbi:penicillin-binding protein [Trueperella pecoris]|uniref:Penicillin-binding protein n=2 Tax=Trueperella pecoris TaxID=2733571 RepID=A0A7M1R2D6_9ACTO|nr:penicillin-binding protein [Trueperella pecoris]